MGVDAEFKCRIAEHWDDEWTDEYVHGLWKELADRFAVYQRGHRDEWLSESCPIEIIGDRQWIKIHTLHRWFDEHYQRGDMFVLWGMFVFLTNHPWIGHVRYQPDVLSEPIDDKTVGHPDQPTSRKRMDELLGMFLYSRRQNI